MSAFGPLARRRYMTAVALWLPLIATLVLSVLAFQGHERLLGRHPPAIDDPGAAQHLVLSLLIGSDVALVLGLAYLMDRSRRSTRKADVKTDQANTRTEVAEARVEQGLRDYEQQYRRTFETAQGHLMERQQAEYQLLLLRICVSHFNDIVLVTEAEPIKGFGRKIVFANEAFERITGYTVHEAMGRTPQFLQGPNTDPVVLAEIRRSLREHKPIRRQLINYRKDGSEYWMDVDIVPIFDLTGKCTYFSAIQRDITEERKSAESLNLFRTLMDRSPDAIEVIDPETGRILDVNATGCRRLGYTREEMLELSLADIVQSAAGSPPFSMAQAGEEIRQTGFKSFEGLHRRKDRSLFPIEVNVQYIQLNRGYLIAVVRDITERKKLENEFLRAQRMESIGTLAGGIAHDLNNILAPIMIAIEILKLTATDPQAKTILQTIEVSAKRGADIVRQVLSFARGLEGEKRPLELGGLLRGLETIVKDTFPKDILMEFISPSDLWMVLGDPTQINQVLLNLCVNARDAMPDGGRLSVHLENTPSPGERWVTITVTDSGTGIDSAIVDKIFDPFFTTKEPNKGTGLGLSTVMTIVKGHGGTINIRCGPNGGSSFVIHLPAIDAVAAPAPPSAPPSLPRGNGEKVLLVDDEAPILIVTAQTLEGFGYRVITATDGAEAVAIYAQQRHEIAVVITDMSMPILDGPSTIYALLRINPKIKIIAASGLVERDELKRTPGTSVKHFLKKPYTATALLTVLRAILDHP